MSDKIRYVGITLFIAGLFSGCELTFCLGLCTHLNITFSLHMFWHCMTLWCWCAVKLWSRWGTVFESSPQILQFGQRTTVHNWEITVLLFYLYIVHFKVLLEAEMNLRLLSFFATLSQWNTVKAGLVLAESHFPLGSGVMLRGNGFIWLFGLSEFYKFKE